ncbi:DUF2934 domain-containing protein [Candidatus Margulisiibacteriota bacterium]
MKDKNKLVEIAAYRKYLDRGCLQGFDQEDWFEAEREVLKSSKPVKKSKN